MTLYLLKPIITEHPITGMNVYPDGYRRIYDCMFGIVVRAQSEEEARQLSKANHAAEAEGAWLDPLRTSCEVLQPDGESEVIIRDILDG